MRKTLFLSGIGVLCAWTLVPLYLIALGAVGGSALVDSWPKPFWPTSLSMRTLIDFMHIDGVWSATLISVEAAVLCMAFSILLGVPAGYALARFRFHGGTAFRLMILLTRAFPVAILALPLTVCSRLRAFRHVVLPLVLPGIAATSIFAFVISWNEVFAASVLTVRHKTLTAYLLSVLSESPLQVQFAGGFVLIIPSVLFIFLVRKHLFAMWGIANR
jgi:multiple sugar transport system permease protein